MFVCEDGSLLDADAYFELVGGDVGDHFSDLIAVVFDHLLEVDVAVNALGVVKLLAFCFLLADVAHFLSAFYSLHF